MNYYISVFPGLAGLAAEEVSARLHAKCGRPWQLRNAWILPVSADAGGLLRLRLAEDVFAQLGVIPLTGRVDDLKTLTRSSLFQGALSKALEPYVATSGKTLPARPRFRVVVQAEDVAWRAYRRVDIQTAAEAALLRSRPNWRLSPDEAPVEVWLQQAGRELIAGLRLTQPGHRTRGGRVNERAAALRPTIAAAMIWLTQPSDEDVFLDPMCGTGTLLLERALYGRYKLLQGGDNDQAAVRAALANFGPRHQPREIQRWDARKLPLESHTVDSFATNLPWGRQIGAGQDLAALYREVLAEARRVVKPGGRIVLLTSEWRVLKAIVKDSGVRLVRIIDNVVVLGRRADIVVLEV